MKVCVFGANEPDRLRQREQRGREDHRDHSGHVDAERHVGRAARRSGGGPTIRFAYWIGIRRWPSCTKTTETTTKSATIGKKSFSTGPPLTQALIPAGAAVRIEAKIRSEMPLPIAALGDQLAHPHQQRRAGRERDHDQHEPAGVRAAARRWRWKR